MYCFEVDDQKQTVGFGETTNFGMFRSSKGLLHTSTSQHRDLWQCRNIHVGAYSCLEDPRSPILTSAHLLKINFNSNTSTLEPLVFRNTKMGSPRVMRGRPIPSPLSSRINKGNKLRPKYTETVFEMQENAEMQRIRTAPKEVILRPPMQNLMFDFRVHRGSQHAKLKPQPEPPPPMPKPSEVHPKTPTPEPLVRDCYLEPLPPPCREDPDPPPPKRPIPPFAPWPRKPEKETQIWPGDLFWFDSDVEPMVEQLVGRCLEQGYMEAQESLQIDSMRAEQESFEFIKIADLDCWERMRLAEIRVEEERQRRLKQEVIITRQEDLRKLKVDAQCLARTYLRQLKTEVINSCLRSGMFYDPLEQEIKAMFLPVLYKGMTAEYNEMVKYRQTTNLLIDETVEPPDYMERAEDGMNIIMARLLGILDSWISFEDNVMIELDATEDASQRVMRGLMGEVGLVTGNSQLLLDDVFAQAEDGVNITGFAVQRAMDSMVRSTEEASNTAHGIVNQILGLFEP